MVLALGRDGSSINSPPASLIASANLAVSSTSAKMVDTGVFPRGAADHAARVEFDQGEIDGSIGEMAGDMIPVPPEVRLLEAEDGAVERRRPLDIRDLEGDMGDLGLAVCLTRHR